MKPFATTGRSVKSREKSSSITGKFEASVGGIPDPQDPPSTEMIVEVPADTMVYDFDETVTDDNASGWVCRNDDVVAYLEG